MTAVLASMSEAYGRIAARADMPFSNPALSVETVGFRDFEDQQVGVLITPWCMNLIALPTARPLPPPSQADETLSLKLPAGEYALHRAHLDGIPDHYALSLFTSVEGFPDMGTARAVAEETLRRLFEPAAAEQTPERTEMGEDALRARPVSRRELLRRVTLGGGESGDA